MARFKVKWMVQYGVSTSLKNNQQKFRFQNMFQGGMK